MMHSKVPLFSAIIPVYNGEKYLTAAIQSVLDLGYEPMELIVVDDGSTDATAEIAARFADQLRYVQQPNRGPAAARNLGLRLSQGNVIGFLDADDFWLPSILTQAFAFLISHHDVEIIQGRIQEIQPSASSATEMAFEFFSAPYAYINIGSALYRKEVFEKVGDFDETMRLCEDYDWFLRAFDARIHKVRVDEVTLLRRLHPDSMTHGKSLHEIGMAKAHKKAIARRRSNGSVKSELPPGFPTLLEYIGSRVQRNPTLKETENDKNSASTPRSNGASRCNSDHPPETLNQILERKDGKPIDVRPEAVVCFMCVRNESLRLPYCLSYYRQLGISRFFIVDNDSTDDGLTYLLDQPDVYVWHTDRSFREARCGTDWIELLLQEYGVNRWCLVVDADELLYYAGCEERRLNALCAELDRKEKRAFTAILLDMYSDKPVKATHYQRGQDFREICSYFDRQFYHFKTDKFFGHDEHASYFGGMRQRVFGGKEPNQDESYFYCLNKVPLIKYDRSFELSDNLHWTNCRDVDNETGCLLHFKYFSSFLDQAREEVLRKQHWNAAIQYVHYADAIDRQPELTLFAEEHSVKFQDSQQLVELGIIRTDKRQSAET